MTEKKKRLTLIFAGLVFTATLACVYWSMRSSLFVVRVVEVVGLTADSPVSVQAVNDLAQVPIGQTSLLSLDLKEIEGRIQSHPWIESVQLEKKPPETLVATIVFRKARAILQSTQDGSMNYVDRQGSVFGPVRLTALEDLPIFSGLSEVKPDKHKKSLVKAHLTEALEFLDRWEKSDVSRFSQLSAMGFDPEKGFRASVTYKLRNGPRLGRATLEIGTQLLHPDDVTWHTMDTNLSRVLRYLSDRSIPAHQIFVGDGKKIVVKTARGS